MWVSFSSLTAPLPWPIYLQELGASAVPRDILKGNPNLSHSLQETPRQRTICYFSRKNLHVGLQKTKNQVKIHHSSGRTCTCFYRRSKAIAGNTTPGCRASSALTISVCSWCTPSTHSPTENWLPFPYGCFHLVGVQFCCFLSHCLWHSVLWFLSWKQQNSHTFHFKFYSIGAVPSPRSTIITTV